MLDLQQILNRSETLEYTKEYRYNEHEGIGGKPKISAGNENLKRFPLKIKLHASFCTPQKIINEIEEKAKNKTNINYFQNGKYVGDYVIERYHINIVQTVKNAIFYAEIEVNLLENPDSITEFKEQNKIEEIPENAETVGENSNIMRNFLNETKKAMKEGVIDAGINAIKMTDLSQLSNLGKSSFEIISNNVLEEIKDFGLNDIYDKISSYTKNLQGVLENDEIATIKRELERIPDTMFNTILR